MSTIIEELGIKTLDTLILKTVNSISIGNRTFSAGEPVFIINDVSVGQLEQSSSLHVARGGYKNMPQVIWEDKRDMTFQFSNGTVNALSLALLLDADLQQKPENSPFPYLEQDIFVNSNGQVYLSYVPLQDYPCFFYIWDKENLQEKIVPTSISGNVITFSEEYADLNVAAYYYFNYQNTQDFYQISKEEFSELFMLEGVFQLKDENEGIIRTGLLQMPKVRILNDITIRMGSHADPLVSSFKVLCLSDYMFNKESCKITILGEDLYNN